MHQGKTRNDGEFHSIGAATNEVGFMVDDFNVRFRKKAGTASTDQSSESTQRVFWFDAASITELNLLTAQANVWCFQASRAEKKSTLLDHNIDERQNIGERQRAPLYLELAPRGIAQRGV
jgi:hypothetical protein